MVSSLNPPIPSPHVDTFDILGCGFGPANLGIAVALADKWSTGNNTFLRAQAKQNQRAIFVEKHPEFKWHPGMLIPGARMQISCLKDLATLRNPCSPFTFLSYLHSQNRLPAFINRGTTIPSRREFADYLAWAAAEVTRRGPVDVVYNEEVIAISRVSINERELIEVTSRRSPSGEIILRRTKNIILSAGGSPKIPRVLASLQPSQFTDESVLTTPVLHTASYITCIRPLLAKLSQSGRPLKIAIVGGGQSSAECLMDIYNKLESFSNSGHQIDMIIRKGSLKPSDDSPFVNEIFDPSSTDEWYNLPTEGLRHHILAEYRNTNYSVVNPKTLDNLYELMYDQKLSDTIAVREKSASELTVRVKLCTNENLIGASIASRVDDDDSSATPHRITLIRQQTRTHELIEDTYDAVICGTGYERTAWLRLLRSSNLAKDLGLGNSTNDTPIRLVPAHYTVTHHVDDEPVHFHGPENSAEHPDAEHDHSNGTESSSSPSTPLSSPSLSFSPTLPAPVHVLISRAYRLLPQVASTGNGRQKPRVYLQGCAEATHGLSDTLLSVIGIRAGEVVDDLYAEGN